MCFRGRSWMNWQQHLDTLEGRSDLAGLIIISGKPGIFIAGADLREFAAALDVPREEVVALCRRGQTLFGRLAKCPFVTVAAIDGVCLGGGAELATWCDRRVFSNNPKTQLGFPEVKLGLFPGWGGTARAPRMVGLGNAAEMITGGESIDARAAQAMGFADDVVPAEKLLPAAIAMVRAEQAKQRLFARPQALEWPSADRRYRARFSGGNIFGAHPATDQRQLSGADGGLGDDVGDGPMPIVRRPANKRPRGCRISLVRR